MSVIGTLIYLIFIDMGKKITNVCKSRVVEYYCILTVTPF